MYQFRKIYNKNWKLKSVQLRSSKNTLAHIVEINTQGQGWRREDQAHVQGAVAAWAQEGLELKVRKGGSEEIPLIQGKEQCLRFAGAAVKRCPTSKVRETQVRW